MATPFGAMATAVVFALGSGTLLPSMQSLATQSVLDEQRGEALGVMQATSSLGIIISSATSGLMYAFLPQLPFAVGAILSAIGFVIALQLPSSEDPIAVSTSAD